MAKKKLTRSVKKTAKPKQAVKKAAKKVAKPLKKQAKKTVVKPAVAKTSSVEPVTTLKKVAAPAKAQKKRKTKADVAAEKQMSKMIKKWQSLQVKSQSKGMKAVPYNMRKTYEDKTPIQHKVLGWGFIISNVNDRLEVLFEDGVKYLISNYK